jgi:hypothetical protein
VSALVEGWALGFVVAAGFLAAAGVLGGSLVRRSSTADLAPAPEPVVAT